VLPKRPARDRTWKVRQTGQDILKFDREKWNEPRLSINSVLADSHVVLTDRRVKKKQGQE
jgi:hypothetical protein